MKSYDDLLNNIFNFKEDKLDLIEAFGLPGSGKSFVCDKLHNQIINKNSNLIFHTIDIFSNKRLVRIFYKFFTIIIILFFKLKIILNVFNILKVFKDLKYKDKLKLFFNWLYISAVIVKGIKSNKLVILDQGISQALWSCFFYNNNNKIDKDNLLANIETLIINIGINSMLIINVKASQDNIRSRLFSRKVRGSSPLNNLDNILIEKGIVSEIHTKIFFDELSIKCNKINQQDVTN